MGSTEYRALGHRFPGLIAFTLPASLAALWLFHNVIKRPVVGLFPVGVQERLHGLHGDFKFGGSFPDFWPSSPRLCWGSQLTWCGTRSPTPTPGPGITSSGWRAGCTCLAWAGFRDTPRMQYGSSIFGVLVLAFGAGVVSRDARLSGRQIRRRAQVPLPLALMMFAVAGVAGFVRARVMVGAPMTPVNFDHFLLYFGLTALDLAFWQVLLYCVLVSSHQVWIIP